MLQQVLWKGEQLTLCESEAAVYMHINIYTQCIHTDFFSTNCIYHSIKIQYKYSFLCIFLHWQYIKCPFTCDFTPYEVHQKYYVVACKAAL